MNTLLFLRSVWIVGVGLIVCASALVVFADLSKDGKMPRWLARLLFALAVFGAIGGCASLLSETVMDHDECAQYVWLDESWKCVPWEEAG